MLMVLNDECTGRETPYRDQLPGEAAHNSTTFLFEGEGGGRSAPRPKSRVRALESAPQQRVVGRLLQAPPHQPLGVQALAQGLFTGDG